MQLLTLFVFAKEDVVSVDVESDVVDVVFICHRSRLHLSIRGSLSLCSNCVNGFVFDRR
jgi:hypothetical protein